ncbi:DUF3105 domain-containing protein [Pseudofrankia inefficax]|uniref:DUF3105 domain-containing protein n=1 Tax=Pseudofrankia inefficax (strain DSM 45817 / CECT 9037 / DDB 130130 / EuI1c) TaxID=298654 RepID=E3J0Z3_PSEI1|nr:DUF3105 domain-containing protein [Pseudofrankia inefficax]ADP84057.1 hypothetical protein FraEuI1c_6073 [Pseudofrankia inefficax]
MAKKTAERNARLEALRREQARKERQRAFLIYGTAGALAVVVLAVVITLSVGSSRSKSASHKVGYVAAPTAAAQAASCVGVVNDRQVGQTHVTADQTVNYPQSPPSSGNHDGDPLPDAIHFYTPTSGIRIERAVHNLEHGFVIGWYDSKLPTAQIAELQKVAGQAGSRFIAVPWTRSVFPDNRHFVLTAWDRTQRCGTVSQDAVFQFVQQYANPSLDGATWDSPTAPESGASGGTLNVTDSGPIPALNGANTQVPTSSPTMNGATTAP